jgi:hypothetical protein
MALNIVQLRSDSLRATVVCALALMGLLWVSGDALGDTCGSYLHTSADSPTPAQAETTADVEHLPPGLPACRGPMCRKAPIRPDVQSPVSVQLPLERDSALFIGVDLSKKPGRDFEIALNLEETPIDMIASRLDRPPR